MDALPLGGIITIAVLLPNLLVLFFPPTTRQEDVQQPSDTRLQILRVVETIGRVGSFIIPFFYRITLESEMEVVALAIMVVSLVLYYAGWIRYLVLGRAEELLYRSMFGLPLPMAVMPVIYFISASILLSSVWLMMAAVMFGVGHISVSFFHSRTIE